MILSPATPIGVPLSEWRGALAPERRDGIVAQTFGGRHIGIGSAALNMLSSGRLSLFLVRLIAGQTATSIGFVTGSIAAVTPTNWWVALYTSARQLVAQSADQGAAAIAANTAYTLALSSPQAIAADGNYYVGLMVAAATVPNMTGISAQINLTSLSPISAGTSDTGLTTTAPNPAAALTASSSVPYMWIV